MCKGKHAVMKFLRTITTKTVLEDSKRATLWQTKTEGNQRTEVDEMNCLLQALYVLIFASAL